MSRVDRQNALIAWAKAATGLDDGHVFMADQKVPQPSDTFVTLRIASDRPNNSFLDEVTHNYDDARAAGSEIEYRVTGHRTMVVQARVYAAPVTDTDSTTAAMSLATELQLGLRLPSVRSAFATAGLALVNVGNVVNMAALMVVAFEGMAMLECQFNYAETASEYGTYIEHVNLTNSTTGDTFNV